MINCRNVIKEYIKRKGKLEKYGDECVNAFNRYFEHFYVQLENCSLFQMEDKPNSLAIQYFDHKYRIYYTDNYGNQIGTVYSYNTDREAYIHYMNMYRNQNKPYNKEGIDINVEEVIGIYILYKGSRQGLWKDYGNLFDTYLQRYSSELKICSLFDLKEKANKLCIRFKDKENLFYIYKTDENAKVSGNVFTYADYMDAAKKYIDLFHEIELID